MRKGFSLLLLVLALVIGLTSVQMVWAQDVPPPDETTPTEPAPPAPIDLTPILTEANTAIDALTVTDEVKARLKATVAERLQEAVNRGFTLEQVQGLVAQMTALVTQCNLGTDLPHVNACFQLMIKFPASDVGGMIAAKLAAGEDLKTALKQTRFELKGKAPKGQTKEKAAKEKRGKGPKGAGSEE